MPTAKVLLRGAVACLAALGIHASGSAQPKIDKVEGDVSGSEERSRATDRVLLEALLERRADLVRLSSGAEGGAAAIDFLDRRIAEVRSRIGS